MAATRGSGAVPTGAIRRGLESATVGRPHPGPQGTDISLDANAVFLYYINLTESGTTDGEPQEAMTSRTGGRMAERARRRTPDARHKEGR